MKEKYEKLKLEVLELETQNIVCQSDGRDPNEPEDDPVP